MNNNASTSIDLAIVDSSSKLVAFSKTDSPIAVEHLAINLVYKFVVDNISNNTVILETAIKKRCLKILFMRYHVILL